MSCGHIAVILKENAGEIPMEKMDKNMLILNLLKKQKMTLTAEFSRINIKGKYRERNNG